MSIQATLMQRASSQCELCQSVNQLCVYEVPPVDISDSDKCILVCDVCFNQLNNKIELEPEHWRCLNGSMWSSVPVVQVVAWRMLKRLSNEVWAQDLLEMLYLDNELQVWAEFVDDDEAGKATLDSNGGVLQAGDTVTLIKDLEVKGANFTAKRGTAVRNISLTTNHEQIEGRVNGTRIVLLTKFLKKSN